ncbi:MAG: RsmD family RNA methyltransferase [Planctomycetota bacterium]|jgi:16S rRNA (guanine966-N2)-methyltransferase|nr:RsmD family RNA methyltransferase [Planctomycetota bacterium]
MRIIAGTARRVGLETPKNLATRPFLEMARGALFNSLGGLVAGARALDLFAGSGALGLEALSRGAASCLFVERDRAAFAALRRNIEACRLGDRAVSRLDEVENFLAGDAGNYNLVFADPPFSEAGEWLAGRQAGNAGAAMARLIEAGGILILRLESGEAPPEWPDFQPAGVRRYGRSLLCRYLKS